MTEEQKPAKLNDEQLASIRTFAFGDEEFQILGETPYPADLIAKWAAADPSTPINVGLTRRDLDHLFFSYAQLGASLAFLQSTIRAITHDDRAAADVTFDKSVELRIKADNNFRAFFAAFLKGVPE